MTKDLIRTRRNGYGVSAISLLGLLCVAGPVGAQTITVDSDAGTIGGQGKGGSFDGATIDRVVMETTGITTFYLLGNVMMPNNQVVQAVGSRPVQFIIGNDLTMLAGATIDASALGATPGAGGGVPAGAAGTGGAGGSAGSGSPAGVGGAGNSAPGTSGGAGATGIDGLMGLAGLLGGDGYGNTGSGGAGGAAATGGTGGTGGTAGAGGPGGGG